MSGIRRWAYKSSIVYKPEEQGSAWIHPKPPLSPFPRKFVEP